MVRVGVMILTTARTYLATTGNEAPEASVQAILDVGDKPPKEDDARVGRSHGHVLITLLLTLSSAHVWIRPMLQRSYLYGWLVGRNTAESAIRSKLAPLL